MSPRNIGFLWQFIAYVLCIAAAWFVTYQYFNTGETPITAAIWADVAATLVIFAFSFAFKNSSFYDAFWSVAPLVILIYWQSLGVGNSTRALLLDISVTWYALRLTANWARSWQDLSHQDWRYLDLQAKTGKFYWLVSLLGIHFFPSVMTFLGSLPMYYALKSEAPLNILDWVAFAVTMLAVFIELFADEQMRAFRKNPANKGKSMTSGLWAYSRHPNYVGETLVWIGLFLAALAVDTQLWWTGIGALAMFLMFRLVTVPMMEERSLKNRPSYAEDTKKIAVYFPLLP